MQLQTQKKTKKRDKRRKKIIDFSWTLRMQRRFVTFECWMMLVTEPIWGENRFGKDANRHNQPRIRTESRFGLLLLAWVLALAVDGFIVGSGHCLKSNFRHSNTQLWISFHETFEAIESILSSRWGDSMRVFSVSLFLLFRRISNPIQNRFIVHTMVDPDVQYTRLL